MADVTEHIKAFAAAIKDDPSLTDGVRAAATELHDNLEAAGSKPASRSKSKPAAEPDKG